MRRTALAMAMAAIGGGGGLGCGGDDDDDPALLCKQVITRPGKSPVSPSTVLRISTGLDASGVPLVKWTWDSIGLRSEERYIYDELGRLVELRLDLPPAGEGDPDPAPGSRPDGRIDILTTVSYFGAMADLTSRDLRTQDARRLGSYVFDGDGRPTTIETEAGITDELRTFQYDAAGRVRVADEQGTSGFFDTRHTEYVFAGEWPSSMRAIVDGAVFDWTFAHAVSPGRVDLRGSMSGAGMFEEDLVYEHDAEGRLTSARRALVPEQDLEIAYAADGAVEILVGGLHLQTYSAGCGVVLEVPRGLPAPRGLMPERYLAPEVPHPYVMPSLIPF